MSKTCCGQNARITRVMIARVNSDVNNVIFAFELVVWRLFNFILITACSELLRLSCLLPLFLDHFLLQILLLSFSISSSTTIS